MIMTPRCSLFISSPKTIVIGILIATLVHSLVNSEETDDDKGSLIESKFGRKLRRLMRTTTEANLESMVGKNKRIQ